MWGCVGWVVPDVSEEHTAIILNIQEVLHSSWTAWLFKMRPLGSSETSGTTHPTAQRHISEDLVPDYIFFLYLQMVWLFGLISVAVRSKAWVYGRSLAGIAGSNPAGSMSVCCECCVLSGRGLCVGLITRPEESYRVWCVWVWSWSLEKWGGLGPQRAVELKESLFGSKEDAILQQHFPQYITY
jgi:hypothetical protein